MIYSNVLKTGVFISGGWNRGVPLYTEVPSFQGVGVLVRYFSGIIIWYLYNNIFILAIMAHNILALKITQ